MTLPPQFVSPEKSFSVIPFWFWNDDLDAAEILAQIAAFESRCVHGFVLHPRIGLSRKFSWMSDALLDMMEVAIEEAHRRGMMVILYDEAMYPSGSSAGQVVAENAAYACRGFVCASEPPVHPEHHLVYEGVRAGGEPLYIIDRPIESGIRGVHFVDEFGNEPLPEGEMLTAWHPEEHPPATDLLNPEAVACFIRLVYDKYYQRFSRYFGNTIAAVFTDEPYVMGRFSPYDPRPGTTGILEHVNRFLGYDFTPYLPALWDDGYPDAERHCADYNRAISRRLEETYYRPISEWCASHGIALTGHPQHPDDIGHMRHFQWPGQDVILNDILPGELAVTRPHSTQAKGAASVALHLNRRRNANEFMGAYGAATTFEIYQFVANWLLVRGCNLLVPHAFFYSTRGARKADCPPQLGPNSLWWGAAALRDFHLQCQRLCWVNTDSRPVCDVAVLGRSDQLPDRIARVLFENQIDFHYLEDRHLWEDARIREDRIEVGTATYSLIVAEPDYISESVTNALSVMRDVGRFLILDDEADFLQKLLRVVQPGVALTAPCAGLRVRLVEKDDAFWCLLSNDSETVIEPTLHLPMDSAWCEVDAARGERLMNIEAEASVQIRLAVGQLRLFFTSAKDVAN